jgi:hypothetical protein
MNRESGLGARGRRLGELEAQSRRQVGGLFNLGRLSVQPKPRPAGYRNILFDGLVEKNKEQPDASVQWSESRLGANSILEIPRDAASKEIDAGPGARPSVDTITKSHVR